MTNSAFFIPSTPDDMSTLLTAKTSPQKKKTDMRSPEILTECIVHTNKADVLPEELRSQTCHKGQKSVINNSSGVAERESHEIGRKG